MVFRMTAQRKTMRNIGRLHSVKCEWCALKMACNCMFDDLRDDIRNPHPLVMCPKCQVTEFLNLLFGKDRARGTAATAIDERDERIDRRVGAAARCCIKGKGQDKV